ncbi:MAG: alpha/beta fold hydrolase [Alphaproteobacteria bacterium]|nr:alpha/beta fold hydrolase [Alphaproteobacteria bacterium]
MSGFQLNENSKTGNMDLFQFAVLNPQIALLAFLRLGEKMASQPQKIENSQMDLLNRYLELQKTFIQELCENRKSCLDLKYNEKEKKFEEDAFANNPMMLFVRRFYETTSSWMMDTLDSFENIDPKIVHHAKFFMKQYIDMLSPDNFPLLNPKVLQETLNTHGENFKKGMEMFLDDLKNGTITTNDKKSFAIGKNIANTPGKVIFQNDIIELIQYSATTDKVFAKPILFIPPWINKFYILDLNEKYSFVKWAVNQGITVFMISWINPDKRYRNVSFEDYAIEGVVTAINKIHEITKSESVHALGYCVGGTLIASLLAHLSDARCKKRPKANIESATLLTTLLDFQHAGDMSVFMTSNYLDAISAQTAEKGVLDGNVMYNTFSALKAKDMIWRYVINSYMLGHKPAPHEILFWNSDPTNLTQSMQKFLSHDLYRDNLLKTGKLKLAGVPINLELIKAPIYMISMRKDHLVPWPAVFDGMKLFKSNVRFVVGGSGHVAGVVNHPDLHKYSYWINDKVTETAKEWFDTAREIQGSWWNNWFEWIKPMMGKLITPPIIKDFVRDAPGIYVKNMVPEQLAMQKSHKNGKK